MTFGLQRSASTKCATAYAPREESGKPRHVPEHYVEVFFKKIGGGGGGDG
jgi:hypothetical protein